ncbi:MAG: arylsulfatase, partial [Planctomycetota bacterium]
MRRRALASGTKRDFTLHQTISLALAIRQGPWKYLDHQGSGGNNYGQPNLKQFALEDTAPNAPGQLYHLGSDPGETTNLYDEQLAIAQQLKSKLDEFRGSGRSVP